MTISSQQTTSIPITPRNNLVAMIRMRRMVIPDNSHKTSTQLCPYHSAFFVIRMLSPTTHR